MLNRQGAREEAREREALLSRFAQPMYHRLLFAWYLTLVTEPSSSHPFSRYGFDTDALDEEGNIIATQEQVTADSHLSQVLGSNSNKDRVQEAMRQQVGTTSYTSTIGKA